MMKRSMAGEIAAAGARGSWRMKERRSEQGDTMGKYKESRSTESSLLLGGETIHTMEIEDTVTIETGKGLG